MLGLALTREGSFERALVHLGRALELRPGLGRLHELMAISLEGLGREEEAQHHRRQAAKGQGEGTP